MTAVIVTIPGGLSSDGLQIAVTLDGDSGVDDVLLRPAYSTQAWERLTAIGGTVEVRA